MNPRYFSYPIIVESRYQKDKYFVIRLLSSKRNGRIPPYTRCSKDTDLKTCEILCDIIEHGLFSELYPNENKSWQ